MNDYVESRNGNGGVCSRRVREVSSSAAIKLVDKCCESAIKEGGSNGLIVFGKSKSSANSVIAQVDKRYSHNQCDGVTKIPVLFVNVPVDSTTKSLATLLLHQLGAGESSYKGCERAKMNRVIALMESAGVKVVVCVNFERMVHKEKLNATHNFANLLSYLVYMTGVCLIAIGRQSGVPLLETGSQLNKCFEEEVLVGCSRREAN